MTPTDTPARRGRPPLNSAPMSGAEKAALYEKRLRENGGRKVRANLTPELAERLDRIKEALQTDSDAEAVKHAISKVKIR